MAFTVTAETVTSYLTGARRARRGLRLFGHRGDGGGRARSATMALWRHGIIRWSGYNNIPPSAHFSPAITTIDQKTDVAGALLVEKLMQQIDGGRPRSIMLPTQMVVRGDLTGDLRRAARARTPKIAKCAPQTAAARIFLEIVIIRPVSVAREDREEQHDGGRQQGSIQDSLAFADDGWTVTITGEDPARQGWADTILALSNGRDRGARHHRGAR